jgi:hypothetical protein
MTPESRTIVGALSAAFAVLSLIAVPQAGQSQPTAGGTKARAGAVPKTPWGDPDLEGNWTNTTTTLCLIESSSGRRSRSDHLSAAVGRGQTGALAVLISPAGHRRARVAIGGSEVRSPL